MNDEPDQAKTAPAKSSHSYLEKIVAYSTAAAVIVALFGVAYQVHEMRDEAKIQHLIEESDKLDSPTMLTARAALAEARLDRKDQTLVKRDPDDMPDEMWPILNQCDEIGLLARHNYLDVELVWSQMSNTLFYWYTDAEPFIEADRKKQKADLENCVWLIGAMHDYELTRDDGGDLHPSDNQIYDFYVSEADAQPGQLSGPTHNK